MKVMTVRTLTRTRPAAQIRAASRSWLVRWVALIPLAFANGALRAAYEPLTGELVAHQISGVTLVLLVLWWAERTAAVHPLHSDAEALAVGAAWAVLTVLFEFGFFHYVGGTSWAELTAAYDLTEGHTWALVVAAIGLIPYVVRRLREGAG